MLINVMLIKKHVLHSHEVTCHQDSDVIDLNNVCTKCDSGK